MSVNRQDPMQAYDPTTGEMLHPNPDPNRYRVATSGPNAGRYMPYSATKEFLKDLLPLAVPLGAAAGASFLPAAGAGGGGAAAGGALPATVPGSYASALYASGGFGVPGGTAAGVAAGTGGLGTIAANTAGGAAANAAANAGGNAARGAGGALLDQLTSGKSLAGLAGLIASLVAGRGNGVGDATAAFNQQYPQLNQLLDMSAQRAQRTDPLHQAVTQLAMSRLPTNVQR